MLVCYSPTKPPDYYSKIYVILKLRSAPVLMPVIASAYFLVIVFPVLGKERNATLLPVISIEESRNRVSFKVHASSELRAISVLRNRSLRYLKLTV